MLFGSVYTFAWIICLDFLKNAIPRQTATPCPPCYLLTRAYSSLYDAEEIYAPPSLLYSDIDIVHRSDLMRAWLHASAWLNSSLTVRHTSFVLDLRTPAPSCRPYRPQYYPPQNSVQGSRTGSVRS